MNGAGLLHKAVMRRSVNLGDARSMMTDRQTVPVGGTTLYTPPQAPARSVLASASPARMSSGSGPSQPT